MRHIMILLFLLVGISGGIFSQTKRMRRDELTVNVQVSVSTLSDYYFRYHYTFSNANNSRQSMKRIAIELHDEWLKYGGTLRNVISPKEKDWGEYPTVGRTMRWIEGYDTTGIDVLERPPKSVILPGERLSFSLECKGLPAIGNFWASGWAPWYFTAEEKDSLIKEGYPESDLHDTDENALRGTTIVPRLIGAPFVPVSFLDTLASYKHQALALGWIVDRKEDKDEEDEEKGDGIVAKLDKRLDKARAALLKGDSSKARKELREFVKKVEELYNETQEHEKERKNDKVSFTSEAYALLKFNAEYLIDRLPKEKGEKSK